MSEGSYHWTNHEHNEEYETLFRPDGTEVTTITEPEDRNFYRDLAPVCVELNALQAENARLREQADALADALGGITYSGPICFPEDGGRCHWCEGKEAHGHADHCDWIRGDAALRTYREANRG